LGGTMTRQCSAPGRSACDSTRSFLRARKTLPHATLPGKTRVRVPPHLTPRMEFRKQVRRLGTKRPVGHLANYACDAHIDFDETRDRLAKAPERKGPRAWNRLGFSGVVCERARPIARSCSRVSVGRFERPLAVRVPCDRLSRGRVASSEPIREACFCSSKVVRVFAALMDCGTGRARVFSPNPLIGRALHVRSRCADRFI